MTVDPFVLLAPVLLLAVIALFRFVGCLLKPDLPSVPPVTVTFENLPTPAPGTDAPLDGMYANLDFGMGRWRLEGPFGPDSKNNIFFAGTGTAQDFRFVNGPRALASLNVFTRTTGDITLREADGSQRTFGPLTIMADPMMHTVNTGWTGQGATTVTVTFIAPGGLGADLGIDTITYLGPP